MGETKEHFCKSAAFHTTKAYPARGWDDWHHYIRHTLQGWWERQREWYEGQVEQMNIPKGPDDLNQILSLPQFQPQIRCILACSL